MLAFNGHDWRFAKPMTVCISRATTLRDFKAKLELELNFYATEVEKSTKTNPIKDEMRLW